MQRINRAIDFILQNLSGPIRLQDVASAADLSSYHFHRIFHAIVGETVADFVKRRRLEKALAAMAVTPRLSYTRIALDAGFSSSSDFTRSFKQAHGVAPSRFDIAAWRELHLGQLQQVMALPVVSLSDIDGLSANEDRFEVRVRELAPKTLAYIRVTDPYRDNRVMHAAKRLEQWAEMRGCVEHAWYGYQWENPEIVPLEQCAYCIAVECTDFEPTGEISRCSFPSFMVAEIEVRGGVDLELRAFQWLLGGWLLNSRYVPDDYPCFEAWMGRPFEHGVDQFQLNVQLPIRSG